MGTVEVVLEGDVFCVKVVAKHVDGGIAGLVAARALAGVVDDDGLAGIGVRALQSDVRLVDDDLLAVGAGRDEDDPAGRWHVIDGRLHGGVLTSAVSGHAKGGNAWCRRLVALLAMRRSVDAHQGECEQGINTERSTLWSDHDVEEDSPFHAHRANHDGCLSNGPAWAIPPVCQRNVETLFVARSSHGRTHYLASICTLTLFLSGR